MHKNATKRNETLSKWCKNKHGASKIIDTFETYHLALAMVASKKEPNEPLSSRTVAFSNSAEVVACACGDVNNLLITDGESRATEVFRVVPLLVVDGNIGTFPSRGLPMMNVLQRII
jgi:hypothetical protein